MGFLALLFVATADAAFSVPNIYASHMVFQRDVPNPIWGWDVSGSLITITSPGGTVQTHTQANNIWSAVLPAQPANVSASVVVINTTTPGQPQIVLSDILYGDLFVCSGQSNMGLQVAATVNYTQYLVEADSLGPILRILEVAPVAAYENTTTPQSTTELAIAWGRASKTNVGDMSAVCYYFGREAVLANPGIPIGMLASAWGGTAINVWMDPTSLKQCGGAPETFASNPDPGLSYLGKGPLGFPTHDSCLYYSMIVPLQTLPVKGFLWYQGESNAGDPVGYARCFPEMISQWRYAWNQVSGGSVYAPFFFVQLSSWPAGDNGVIAVQRIAQQAALQLPDVGMAVAADLGDPAGPVHPIHPPNKQEVARRMFISARNIVYGQTQFPREGPRLRKVVMDPWDSSWGDFHQGLGRVNVCEPGTNFFCFGIRLFFDQPLVLHDSWQQVNGDAGCFELLVKGQTQPAGLTGVSPSDPTMLQLNVTLVVGDPKDAVLRYGWRDYPRMPLSNTLGMAAPSFNVSLS